MPDLIGLVLILLPIGVYLLWRGLSILPISTAVVAASLLALLLLIATVAWFGFLRAIPAGEGYRPAQVSGASIRSGGAAK